MPLEFQTSDGHPIRPNAPEEPYLPAWTPWVHCGMEDGVPSFQNSRYVVSVRREKANLFGRRMTVYRLGITNYDQSARHDWRDFQRIKNELVHPEAEALELYPAERRLVDPSNHFILWVLDRGNSLTIGEPFRFVLPSSVSAAPQRDWPAGQEPAFTDVPPKMRGLRPWREGAREVREGGGTGEAPRG